MRHEAFLVRDFHRAFNVDNALRPVPLRSDKSKELRHSLLQEEVDELKKALEQDDIIGAADGIIDCMYILLGTANMIGIAGCIHKLFAEVHASNMSKFDGLGKPIYREDGKVLKGENYFKPNLAKVLNDYYGQHNDYVPF